MAQPTDEQLAELGAAFELFSRRYKLTDVIGDGKPMNDLDKLALFFVSRSPGCGPTDIARFLGVPNTTISSATDRLVKRGLLERQPLERDRRAVALRLSEEGEVRTAALLAMHNEMSRKMLEPLSPAERSQLIALMTKIAQFEG